MANYAVGDIQGCYKEFDKGLKKINFNEKKDRLWISGDIVNRGPDSLKTLERIYSIRSSVNIVLGNHDLHFLARHYADRKSAKNDTLEELLASSKCEKYAKFLLKQPFVFSKKIKLKNGDKKKYIMVHAGLPHYLTFKECMNLNKLSQEFLSKNPKKNLKKIFFHHRKNNFKIISMKDKLAFFINAVTRIRICDKEGKIMFAFKKGLKDLPFNFVPWFKLKISALTRNDRLIFGHWAALNGKTNKQNIIGLDTGCVWGNKLTFLRLEDNKKYFIKKIK
ncbi:symmetrical bis(5'-nucleosyl)-tetraphosphatase [SAR86 cluster bacterium]|jgi:bis(5'-nucleosyl)-tetraphosphatase (symmetrical)|nr:symmetrical bis(5'-nucleosyl)-tetraphosphatase [SAR86 cluster bacterium]